MRLLRTGAILLYLFFAGFGLSAQLVNKGTIISVNNGVEVTVNGELLNEGVLRNGGVLYVKGDFTNLNNYLSQEGKLVLNGNTVQQVETNNDIFYILELNGGGRKVFTSDVEVINELILVSGIAEVSSDRTFLLQEGGIATGGSNLSYIEGGFSAEGTGDLFFPVGTNGKYAPIELLDVTGNSPVTRMEVFEPKPEGTAGTGVSTLSDVRYWQRTLVSGSFNNALVKISLNQEVQFSEINNTVVAASDTPDGEYISLGQRNNTGSTASGTVTGFDRTSATIFAAARELNEGRKSDSLALVSLYEINGGPEWTDNTNWLQAGTTLEDWFGVVTDPGTERVIQLNLPNNNLTGELSTQVRLIEELAVLNLADNNLSGTLPQQLVALPLLTTINISGNALNALPDLSTLPAVTDFNVSGNQLTFASLEANSSINGINYVPQDSLSDTGVSLRLKQGVTLPLTVPEDSENSIYQWLLNEEPIAGANLPTYTIEELNRDNMGEYRCIVTNDLVPGLTITSEVMNIVAVASISGAIRTSETEFLDAGTLKLLKVTEMGAYEEAQTGPVLPSGQYEFPDVVLADYVIFADPSDQETFLPTYHEQQIQWDLADVIVLERDTVNVDVFVESKPVPFTPDDGNGVFGGQIFSDFEEDAEEGRIEARRRVRRVGVALRRRRSNGRTQDDEFGDFELVGYQQTDDEGRFSFGNLPPGTYRVFIEFPGIPLNPDTFTEFELGEDLDENEITVEATVFEDGIEIEKVEETGIPYDYLKQLNIYPNPVSDGKLNLALEANGAYEITIELVDLTGKAVLRETLSHHLLRSGVKTLDVGSFSSGIYLLKISVPEYGGQLYKVGKVVIRN